MWFKKKEQDNNEIEVLKESIRSLKLENNKINEKFTNEIGKLKRIIRYSSNNPTFNLEVNRVSKNYFIGSIIADREYELFIYIDNEEYCVELSEIRNDCIDNDSFEFFVKGELAYFKISTYHGSLRDWKRWEFIVDYKNGKYVVSNKEDVERNKKEIEKNK